MKKAEQYMKEISGSRQRLLSVYMFFKIEENKTKNEMSIKGKSL